MTSYKTLAFELGTEEIPAFDLHNATLQLEKLVPKKFDDAKIPYGEVKIYSSPRRLIIMMSDVADMTEAVDEVFKGPAARIAFDEEGNLTKAGMGFARSKGVSEDGLERREVKGTEYLYATRHVEAKPTVGLIGEILESLIPALSWPRSCRWGTRTELFSRPVRWIVALLGDEIIPVSFAGLSSDRFTVGHRVLAPGKHEVDTAKHLLDVVRSAYVVPSEAEREQVIRAGVNQIEEETGYTAELPARTLLEVTNLSEYPTVLMASFDLDFLQVPEEIIVDAMLMHQRYFPLYDQEGKLSNRFIVVSNGDPEYSDLIIAGNERVVRARLDDAKFFYEEDLKKPLESYVEGLDAVVFTKELGTVRAKTDRLVRIAAHLAKDANLNEVDTTDALRAAYLAKADLVTNAVVEFTSVQGIMGGYYALASGETEQVSQAISDQYHPRFAGDQPPRSVVGNVLAIADKIDTICGLFAVGQGPTGSSDPFALRRSAIGILAMVSAGCPISVVSAVEAMLAIYAEDGLEFDYDAVRAEIVEFFIARTRVSLRDEGFKADTIDAVLSCGVTEPLDIIARVNALEHARSEEPAVFESLAIAHARANNLRDEKLGIELNEEIFLPVEKRLFDAIVAAEVEIDPLLAQGDYASALESLSSLRGPIDDLFEEVMIMDDDMALRENHLKMLNRFVRVFARVADFGKMAKAAK